MVSNLGFGVLSLALTRPTILFAFYSVHVLIYMLKNEQYNGNSIMGLARLGLGALGALSLALARPSIGPCSRRLSAFGAKPKLDTNTKPFLQNHVRNLIY